MDKTKAPDEADANQQNKSKRPTPMGTTKQTNEADTNQQKELKRPKLSSQLPLTIEDLNARKVGTTFIGNALVIYKVVLDKGIGMREVLRADLTDSKGEMTITLTVGSNLVRKFEDKIMPGTTIAITDFKVAPKTEYDRGDCDYILILQDSSKIETIPALPSEYKFIPGTTIKQLLTSTSEYANGTIGAIVVATNTKGTQYILDIKDGHTDMDKAPLYMHPNFYQLFCQMQQQLQNNEIPILLFRNIAKKQDQKHALRTTPSTYICSLNDKRTLEKLHALMHTTFEVIGLLRPANAYSNPFYAFCPECNYRFDSYAALNDEKAHCFKCNKEVNYIYSLHMNAVITNNNNQTIHCFAEKTIAEQIWPYFKNMSYEEYVKDKPAVIFMLRDFTLRGKFSLNQHSQITRLLALED